MIVICEIVKVIQKIIFFNYEFSITFQLLFPTIGRLPRIEIEKKYPASLGLLRKINAQKGILLDFRNLLHLRYFTVSNCYIF